MIVKMIEESFNEPFKTGPLIDQQGHYAIFDILMNRQMFDYIMAHQSEYQSRTSRQCGPRGRLSSPVQAKPDIRQSAFGSFMLKVSWKILTPERSRRRTSTWWTPWC